MKTKEELNTLKEEVEAVNRKLHELTEEDLAQVVGGQGVPGGLLDIGHAAHSVHVEHIPDARAFEPTGYGQAELIKKSDIALS